MTNQASKHIALFLLLVATISITSCASGRDPYEGYNRKVFALKMGIDKVIYRPAAKVYDTVLPTPVHRGVSNVFSNIRDITAVANDILQANPRLTLSDAWRVLVNSTLGVLGLFDVASHIGLPKHQQDFGLTLAKWGVRKTPYMVVPFFGPSTLRDSIGFIVDYQLLSPWPHVRPLKVRYLLYAVDLIDQRAALLPTDKLVKQAFDPYIFVRNAYLQRRSKQINEIVHGQHVETDTYVDNNNHTADSDQ